VAVFRKGAGVPEFREDATDDGFHEIQLSRKQLVFLFMTGSVALILVFLFGVVVGRDTATKGVQQPTPTADLGSPPAPEPGTTPVVPPEPKDDTAAGTDAPVQSQPLSYPALVKGDTPKTEPKSQAPPPAAPVVEPAPPAGATKQPNPSPAPDAGPKVPTSGAPGAWVIQISALKSREAAAEWVQRLRTKGYPAFLDNSVPGVFRVRVGRFKDRADADRTARRLLKEERTQSVISR
jgi:DedD protein